MIENELREAFARREHLIPDAARLVPAINERVRQRRRGRRWLLRSGAAALAVALVVGVPALARTLASRPDDGTDRAAEPKSLAGRPLNFLVAGIDRWPSQPAADLNRADTIVVVHVPADRRAIYLITIPRDTYVDIPERGQDKINYSYGFGGFPLLARTVSGVTGVGFDGAATVDLAGMVRAVDAVGGVDMCVDQRVRSIHTGRVFERGCRHFSGAEARDYLRQRNDLAQGPLDRDRHQVHFLQALLKKLNTMGTLTDPGKLRALVDTVKTSVVLDTGGHDIVDLAWELRGGLDSVIGIATPVTATPVTESSRPSGWTLTAESASLFEAVRADRLGDWLAAHPNARSR